MALIMVTSVGFCKGDQDFVAGSSSMSLSWGWSVHIHLNTSLSAKEKKTVNIFFLKKRYVQASTSE